MWTTANINHEQGEGIDNGNYCNTIKELSYSYYVLVHIYKHVYIDNSPIRTIH